MKNLEEIYNQSLEMLKKGHSKEEVLSKFPEVAAELSPLLEISSSLLLMPKNQIPKPAMQRKYVFASGKRMWIAWLHVSKFAGVSVGLMLLIAAGGLTVYASFSTLPGQTLFAVKKSAEQARLFLAYNDTDKANIQVSIAQQRLNDAEAVFSNPSSNVEQKKAALDELTQQTSTAVAAVNSVAQSNPQSKQSPPLVSSLADINKQQRNLLTQIQPDAQIKEVASNALQTADADNAKISAIEEHVAVANNDQSLVQLTANPDSVAILGTITEVSNNDITVEKTKFVITSQTVIKDVKGNPVTIASLATKQKVNIVGIQDNTTLIAQQILVTSTSTDGQVKGDSTTTPSSDEKNSSSSTDSLKNSGNDQTDTSSSSTSSGTATGSFILEDPAPQFPGK